ncbi:hypothetical protein J5N97_029544 [Dioscorea zingiberensis]|uniref:C2H2-type domain-containing protein n=1 Tax=Dioscorea zingiberensis TaxID=325984 RepID=A0A9D5C1S2_9LILI|nr:hypothetical protein J5N97_029544 [Dioscorea zingiberensis]
MSSSASCSNGDHLLRQIMRSTAPHQAAQVEVFPCKKCPKVFSCQQAMAGHMKGHSTKIHKKSKKSTHHSKLIGESSKRHDPVQLDRKGKQLVPAFGLNTNTNPNLGLQLPPQFNPNRNLIISEPVMPLNPFQALASPPPPENFIPFGVPIERVPLAYAVLEETYSPPLFNNPHDVTIAYKPVIRYSSNSLVNPLGMYPSKRYVPPPSFLQTGYEEDKDCSYASSMNIDGAKESTSTWEKKHEELDLNLYYIDSGPTYNNKETADEDLDLELHL